MSFVFIILFATILANLIFGWVVFRNQRHSISNKIFLLIPVSIVLWSFSKILFYSSPEAIVNLIAIPMLYISGASIATSFLLFSHIFPEEKSNFSKKFYVTILIIPAIIVFLILFTNLILGSLVEINGVRTITFGNLYFIYVLFVSVYFGIGYILLFKKLRKSKGILRAQFSYVLLGSVISSVIGVSTNVIMPWFENFSLFWAGPPLTIIMVVLFTYSIIKHHLMNVRVIATELFTALILMVVLMDTILADNLREFLIKGGIFLTILVFSIFLIRGTLREIRELERLSRAKSEFVSIVSHQLRTPLTAIKGFVSMIQEGSGTEKDRKDWLEKTYISNERLIRLVNDILNISRIERGTIKYDFQEISIVSLLDEVVEEMRGQTEKKGLSLVWEKFPGKIPPVRVDEDKLRQVFLNLIDNALKYTEKGSIFLKVNYFKDLKHVRITVQDTGIGIDQKDSKNLFDMFSRGGGGEKTNTEGMGIGLYVAKQIVLAHKGKIWSESEGLGKGTKFHVELPVE